MGISFRPGEYMSYSEEEQEYITDFSLTLIYEENESNPDNYLYWEQDGYSISVYNYLNSICKRVEMEALEKKQCLITIEMEES